MSFTALSPAQYKALKDYPLLTFGLADSPYGPLAVAWWPDTKKGDLICYLALQAKDISTLSALKKLFPYNALNRDDRRAEKFAKDYFKTQTPPSVLMKGTPLFLDVWKKLYASKSGFTASYGQLAALCGKPLASRAVGRAMATNPIALIVPCHRILASTGGLGGYAYGLDVKKRLLAAENS